MTRTLEVKCRGTPYEIGHQHGNAGRTQVHGSLDFYAKFFKKTCSMDWKCVRAEAEKYAASLQFLCPRYVKEMQGLSDGAGVKFLDIVALNVRTEIAFGLFTSDPSLDVSIDGCTSLACKNSKGERFLSQNWDWKIEQSSNIIICHISQPGTGIPDVTMVTEAGVIGKIGLNANGVGVCLNAIRAYGVDPARLPIHLALRTALESSSAFAAVQKVQEIGTAGSGHILVADRKDSFGVECTSHGVKVIVPDINGTIVHTNHLLLNHPEVNEPPWLPDSEKRFKRLNYLLQERISSQTVDVHHLFELFQDQEGYPGGINRYEVEESEAQTLFNIIMELNEGSATVTFGQPCKIQERIRFSF